MTYQEVLKETDTFTTEQKEQLMLFMLSKFDEKKRNRMIQLFHYENNVETDDIYNSIDAICGSGKGLWKEDAQVYINKLREDDRKF